MEIGKKESKVFQVFTDEMAYTKNTLIPNKQFHNIA